MGCSECGRLLGEYKAASAALSDAIKGLPWKRDQEFREAMAAIEAAHTALNKAWRALIDHRLEHSSFID
jgi:cellobiose-specific phosphotransferase system component IIA